MKKYIFLIFLFFIYLSPGNSKNMSIDENLNISFNCEFQKIILKNQENNYKTYYLDDFENKNIDKLKIQAKKPNILNVKGLTKFLTEVDDFEVKIVNYKIIYLKAFDKLKNYSESAILNRITGELMHEITNNINASNQDKEISFYNCKKVNQNV
tara:strand:+ start:64 stop:525 length:462 start_codon:yes stop_codon:yes gene_type:complete